MSNGYRPSTMGRSVIQTGTPMKAPWDKTVSARGLHLRGVVTAVYEVDNADHPHADNDPVTMYADVMCYASMAGMRWRFIPQALVMQPLGSGMHRGQVWKPRAAQIDVTTDTIDMDRITNPANLDGDHVIVTFLDDNFNTPIIIGSAPHPIADTGHSDDTGDNYAGARVRLLNTDGDPNFWRHHGTYFGVADTGDFQVDTRFANDGTLDDAGLETPPDNTKGKILKDIPMDVEETTTLHDMTDPTAPAPVGQEQLTKVLKKITLDDATAKIELIVDAAADASTETLEKALKAIILNDAAGKISQKVDGAGAATEETLEKALKAFLINDAAGVLEVKIDGGASIKIEKKDADAVVTVGDGSKSVAIFENLQTYIDSTVKPLFDAFDAHIHPTGVGPSGPPAPVVAFPTLATNVQSTHLKIPDV